MLIEYILSILYTLKKHLIGDLNLLDLFKLIRERQLPMDYQQMLGGTRIATQNQEIMVKELGLLGKIIQIPNVALINATENSTIEMNHVLNDIDTLPNARRLYNSFNTLTDTTQFITQTGAEALHQRKKFVQVLPHPHKVFETTLEIIATVFTEHQINPLNFFEEGGQNLMLVRHILVKLLLGCDLTPEMNEAIGSMHALLIENYQPNSQILKNDYKNWVHQSLSQVLTSANKSEFCSLAKVIKQQMNSKDDSLPSIENLEHDPLIHSLFTVITTANNIAILIYASCRKTHFLDNLKYIQKEIAEKQLQIGDGTNLNSDTYDKLRKMESLENLFQFAQYKSNFNSEALLRYIEQDAEINGEKIPANTQLVVYHNVSTYTEFVKYTKTNEKVMLVDNFVAEIKPGINPHKFSPFSVGARSCPGKIIAEMIFKATMLMLAEIGPKNIQELWVIDETHKTNFNLVDKPFNHKDVENSLVCK